MGKDSSFTQKQAQCAFMVCNKTNVVTTYKTTCKNT